MIQLLGGGRVIDHGPASAIHSRSRVPCGVMVGAAIVPRLTLRGLGSGPTGTGGTIVPRLQDTPEQAVDRKARARTQYALFVQRHTGCACHVLYGNQPRPIGYLARERDRSALRRGR